MARTDDDTWEITESVAATALGVAAARAAETESEHPLISDPFARIFLDAAGDGPWNWHSADRLPAEVIEAEPELPLRMQTLASYMASRTAFFDEFFLDRIGVPVDLRQNWPAALQQAGFDASEPSAWQAEGLMPYLPAAGQESLFDRVHGLTVAGSRIAVEALGPNFADPEYRTKRREWIDRARALMAKADPQRELPGTDELWYFEEREDVGDWLRRHGWEVTVTPSPELLAGYGRKPPEEVEDAAPPNLFVSAQRPGT